jgi:hypothetical protein
VPPAVPHARAHERGLGVLVHTVEREDVLGEIDSDVDNGPGLPLPGELMRVRASHRGTSSPVATSRPVRDGQVPFIRQAAQPTRRVHP